MNDHPDELDESDDYYVDAEEPDINIDAIFDREPPWGEWPPAQAHVQLDVCHHYAAGQHPNPKKGIDAPDPEKNELYGRISTRAESAILDKVLVVKVRKGIEWVRVSDYYQWAKDEGNEFFNSLHPEFIARDPSLPNNRDNSPEEIGEDTDLDNELSESSNTGHLQISDALPPRGYPGIAQIFKLEREEESNLSRWKKYSENAARNGLIDARVSKGAGKAPSTFDPWRVGEWVVANGHLGRDVVNRRLAANLEPGYEDLKDEILQ